MPTTSRTTTDAVHQEVRREQDALDGLFARRDGLLTEVRAQLRDAQDAQTYDDAESAARIAGLVRRRTELDRADSGLCFGRVEEVDGTRLHIGRVGLPADDGADPMLVDWRAPMARKFYTATAARPQGLRSRRHIRTDRRTVLGVDDEAFDRDGHGDDLVGEAALLEALDARRTGAMGDVVATLQSEQDEVIRAPHGGCLVVQGGPGTGKTAVALHRAAYLLFTYPQLAERGVLVVGPSPTFLRYIEQVLPSLGETQVVASTVDRLLPGVETERSDDARVAEIKGRAVWAEILRRVIEARRPAAAAVEVHHGDDLMSLDHAQVVDALAAARAAGASHYAARAAFRVRVIDLLTRRVVEHNQEMLSTVEAGFEDVLSRVDAAMARQSEALPSKVDSDGVDVDGVATVADIAALRRDIAHSPEVIAMLDEIWPALEPELVLAGLLSSPSRLDEYAPELSRAEKRAVRKENPSDWSLQDVALLDEVADLVGTPSATNAGAETLAERATADRTWVYGHVVVDEAQELSAMQWRMLVRRCPTRSFTVVGDVNQTESPGGSSSWDVALEASFGRRFAHSELTICYRTPHEIMDRTGAVLATAGSTVVPPRAVRSNGLQPWRRTVNDENVIAEAKVAVRELAGRYRGGQVAVIGTESFRARLGEVRGDGDGDASVTVLTAAESKGLEFDAVLIVEPHAIIAQRKGWNALYVAMTRCTQELGVLATEPGPFELDWH